MIDLMATANLLAYHVPADATEAAHLARMHELLDAEHAFERDHFVPGHFTASAFVVCPERDAVLLIHHAKLGLWLQPGGHFEPSDPTPQQAALRELAEETRVTAVEPLGEGLLDVDVHSIPGRPEAPPHQHFDLRFGFVACSREMAPTAEVRGARWVPLDELVTATTDASVRRAATRLRFRACTADPSLPP